MMKLFVSSLFLLLFSFGLAQVSVIAQVDETEVALGDTFQYTLMVQLDTGDAIESVEYPSLNDAEQVGRQNSKSYRSINGVSSIQWIEQTTFYPLKQGEFRLPPVKVVVNGNVYFTKTKVVKVVEQAFSARNQLAYMTVNWNTDTLYEQEALQASIRLHAREFSIFRRRSEVQPPVEETFEIKQKTQEESIEVTQENTKGQTYYVAEIARFTLRPQQTGVVTIPSFRMKVAIEYGFFNEEIIPLRTKPKEITVLPLPTHMPSGFSGVVGDFTLHWKANQHKVPLHQELKLELIAKGRGDLTSLEAPVFPSLEGIEIYPRSEKTTYVQDSVGQQCVRSFSFSLVPTAVGTYTLPPLEIDYLSKKEGTYSVVKTKPFVFQVLPVSPQVDEEEASNEATEEARVSFDKTPTPTFWSSVGRWLVLAFVVIVALAIGWAYQKKKAKQKKVLSSKEKEPSVEVSPSRPVREEAGDIEWIWKEVEQLYVKGNQVEFLRKSAVLFEKNKALPSALKRQQQSLLYGGKKETALVTQYYQALKELLG